LDGHEWQAQRIVGGRQTPSGLEYEVSVAKVLWLPKVWRYRAEQRSVDQSPHKVVVAAAKARQLGETEALVVSYTLGGRWPL